MYPLRNKFASASPEKIPRGLFCVWLGAVSISARMGDGSMGREVPFKSGGPYVLRPAKHKSLCPISVGAINSG